MLAGTLVASAGLFLFLLGVGVGFLPFGRIVGESLGSLGEKWLLLPFGMLLGFVTARAEPAVGILADQVEEATGGSIRRSAVLLAVCGGVALLVGVGMFRIAYGIPLLYVLVPGYAAAMALMGISNAQFAAIAVDAGGVATGPLANSFLLALAFGASSAMGGQDPLIHGLGLVALIALAPVLSVTSLGVVYRSKQPRKES
jgi:4-amino-4-deoxy-L-arabinose transferase-like glycosyltransferase